MNDEEENVQDEGPADVVRQQLFELDGAAELDVTLGAGQVRVELTEDAGAQVEVRSDPTPNPPWAQGLSSLLNWVGEQFGGRMRPGQYGFEPDFGGFDWGRGWGWQGAHGGRGFGGFGGGFGGPFGPGRGFGGGYGPFDVADEDVDEEEQGRRPRRPRQPRQPFDPGQWAYGWPGMSPDDAVRQTTIEQIGNRIVVHTGQHGPLRMAPLLITIRAPHGSQVNVHAGTADVSVTGKAGRVQVQSGTGDVAVETSDAPARTHTGSGTLRIGDMPAGVSARSGSGDVFITSIGAGSSVSTGSGEVRLGTVSGDLTVRTGSGDLTVREAVRGRLQLVTGSGNIWVGVREGVLASIDLSSRTGTASSDLPVSETPPSQESERVVPELTVRGRTGSGDALVTTALANAG